MNEGTLTVLFVAACIIGLLYDKYRAVKNAIEAIRYKHSEEIKKFCSIIEEYKKENTSLRDKITSYESNQRKP